MRLEIFFFIAIFCIPSHLSAQDTITKFDKAINFPTKFFQKINSSASLLEAKMEKQTEKYLLRMAKQEARLKRNISKMDSLASAKIFENSSSTYDKWLQDIKEKRLALDPKNNSYVSFLDTLKTSMRFLDQADPALISSSKYSPAEIKSTILQLSQLQGKLNQTEEIRKLLIERKQFLKQQVAQFGMVKEFKKFEQDVYYYQEQVKQYKEILNDPQKLEATAIRLIQKIPIVEDFLASHSELASIFRLPNSSNNNSPVNVQGLQTRSSVIQQMQQTLGTGVNPQQLVQQSTGGIESQLKDLKDRITQFGGGGSTDQDLPDFKPSSQRIRPFFKRLEFGSNVQSVKGNYYFPVTSDISMNIGYKISDRNVAGFGVSYKLGLGSGWNKIKLTHQGIGIRTYWDWKLKGSFWISAGGEMNYRAEIKKIDILKNFNSWQSSFLAGISKKYKVGKRMQCNTQLLYDVLHNRQAPPGPAFIFRVGYTFSKK